MSIRRKLARLRSLSRGERAVLREALATHTRIALLSRNTSLKTLAARASAPSYRRPAADPDQIVRMVRMCSRWSPLRSVCLHRALTAHTLLRRRGYESILHYGIAPPGSGFGAHMWVTLGERIVIEADARAAHRCVAHFPDTGQPSPCPG